MNKTFFPVLDAILDALKGNGATNALNARYLHLAEVQRAENTVEAVAKQFGIDLDEVDEFRSTIQLLAGESERQGFINGFRMSSLMRRECCEGVPEEAGFVGGYDFPHGREKDTGTYEAFLKRDSAAQGMTYAFDAQKGVYCAVSQKVSDLDTA